MSRPPSTVNRQPFDLGPLFEQPKDDHPRAEKIENAANRAHKIDPGWFESARAAVLFYGARNKTFTIAQAAEASQLGTPTHGAWGAVTRDLVAKNRIRSAGTTRRKNGNKIDVWELVPQTQESPQ